MLDPTLTVNLPTHLPFSIGAYLGLWEIYMIDLLANIVNSISPLTIGANTSIIDVWQGPKYRHTKIKKPSVHFIKKIFLEENECMTPIRLPTFIFYQKYCFW